jgi:transposase InsO family protein
VARPVLRGRAGGNVILLPDYVKDYRDVQESINGLGGYFEFYNHERLHQSLDYRTPAAVYRHGKAIAAATTFN